jgi:putative intracellular protease/amidase
VGASKSWPYSGYHLTAFATGEEEQLEGPNGVQFYPVNALAEAGAHLDTIANWHRNVVIDRELTSGRQPMSAPKFGDVLLAKLAGKTN